MPTHHIVPRSRGGPDDEWNLVELTEYEHAYGHALDFVLFEHAPMFDARHPGWPLLPEDLREAVRKEYARRRSLYNKSSEKRKDMSKMMVEHHAQGKRPAASRSQAVQLVHNKTGVTWVFPSARLAAKTLGLHVNGISRSALGRRSNIHRGWTISFTNNSHV